LSIENFFEFEQGSKGDFGGVLWPLIFTKKKIYSSFKMELIKPVCGEI